jgi:hypothetical protein
VHAAFALSLLLAGTDAATSQSAATPRPPEASADVRPLAGRVASPLGVSLLAAGSVVAVATATTLDVLGSIRADPTDNDDDKQRNEALAQWGGFTATTGLAIGAGLIVAGLTVLVSDLAPATEGPPSSAP